MQLARRILICIAIDRVPDRRDYPMGDMVFSVLLEGHRGAELCKLLMDDAGGFRVGGSYAVTVEPLDDKGSDVVAP